MELRGRNDRDLAFMLKFENVAWYQEGRVRILDRRLYPLKTRYVTCHSHRQVAQAIADMVTQSEGPYTAAAMGMALAMYECQDLGREEIYNYMEAAAHTLSHARPTTSEQMKGIVAGALAVVERVLRETDNKNDRIEGVFGYAYDYINHNYAKYSLIGKALADLIPDKGRIMTQCFAGTVVGTFLRECRRMGKEISLFCPETRPYYQGARLTASVAHDMGFDVTVITDNMPAYTLKAKKIDLFTSASDVITMDGHIVNKVGTFQIALAAKYYQIPYYVTGTPDLAHKDMTRVVIEERDPDLVVESLGQKLVMEGVKGYYPAFDVTPPEFCTGVVTDKGIFKPRQLAKYFA